MSVEDPVVPCDPNPHPETNMTDVAHEIADDDLARARAVAVRQQALSSSAAYAATAAAASAMDGSLLDSSQLTASSILLELLSVAKTGFKIAPIIAEKAFDVAEFATTKSLDIGREAIARTAAVANASVAIGSAGIMAAAQGIGAVLDADVSTVTQTVHRSSNALQSGIEGSAAMLNTTMHISESIATTGISFGKQFATGSVRAGQTMVETLDTGVAQVLEQTMGIDVKLLRQQSPFETIAELVDLAKEFNDKLKNIDSMEIAQAITVYARLVRAVEDMDIPRSAQVTALRAEQRGATPVTPRIHTSSKPLSHHELSAARIGTLSPVLARYILFSCCAYGPNFMRFLGMCETNTTNMDDFVVEMTGLKKEDVLVTEATSSLSRPGYYLAIDHITHSVVLSIRGSARLLDALTDLRCGYAPFKHGTAHRGMLESATWFNKNLGPRVREALASHPGYRVVVTGHSLGAGVASLLTLLWIDDSTINIPNHPIHCYAFGSPCVISPELSSLGEEYISSFVLGHDIVCRLSLGSVQDLCTVIVRLTRNKESKQREGKGLRLRTSAQYLTRMLDARSEEGSEARQKEDASLRTILHHLRKLMTADKLFPAGHVYHLLRCDEPQQQQEQANGLSPTSISLSLPTTTPTTSTSTSTTTSLATSSSLNTLPLLPPSVVSTMSTSPIPSISTTPTPSTPPSPRSSNDLQMSPNTFTREVIATIGDISPPMTSRDPPPPPSLLHTLNEAYNDLSRVMTGDFASSFEEKTVLHNIATLTQTTEPIITSTPSTNVISLQQHSLGVLAAARQNSGKQPETKGFYLIQGHWTDLTEMVFSSRTFYDHMPELYHSAVMLAAPPHVAVKEARKDIVTERSVPLASTHVTHT